MPELAVQAVEFGDGRVEVGAIALASRVVGFPDGVDVEGGFRLVGCGVGGARDGGKARRKRGRKRPKSARESSEGSARRTVVRDEVHDLVGVGINVVDAEDGVATCEGEEKGQPRAELRRAKGNALAGVRAPEMYAIPCAVSALRSS